jgi:hypothetical protein
MCTSCWNDRIAEIAEFTPGEVGPDEICCACGKPTRSGLYTRVDPTTVDFPTRQK